MDTHGWQDSFTVGEWVVQMQRDVDGKRRFVPICVENNNTPLVMSVTQEDVNIYELRGYEKMKWT